MEAWGSNRTIVRKGDTLAYVLNSALEHPLTIFCQPLVNELNNGKSSIMMYLKLIVVYSSAFDDHLTWSDITDHQTSSFLARFLKSIQSKKLIDFTNNTFDTYLNITNKLLRYIFDKLSSNQSFEYQHFNVLELICRAKMNPIDPAYADYYSGWWVTTKTNTSYYINLRYIWLNEGIEVTRNLEKNIQGVLGGYRKINQYINTLNRYLLYISDYEYKELKYNRNIVDSCNLNFMQYFFEKNVDENNCLSNAKKRWNDTAHIIGKIFFDTGFFSKPSNEFVYIPHKYKDSSNVRVKAKSDNSGNEVQVKDKLLTEIPINISDDALVDRVIKKIQLEHRMCLSWARQTFDELWKRFSNHSIQFDVKDIGLSNADFRVKYGLNRKTKDGSNLSKTVLAYDLGMPTTHALLPSMFLLVGENPEITESFLYNFELYDKNGHLSGIREVNENLTYMVGYKFRKTGDKKEQKIKLNETSKGIVEAVIKITSDIRGLMKDKGDDSYRYLFLTTGVAFSYPRLMKPVETYSDESKYMKSRHSQLANINEDYSYNEISTLNRNLTLSKFRASCGVVDYIKHGDPVRMSKLLGHAKYKPELINHYLHDSIIRFLQNRSIRLFQKAIVAEAMKDSDHLHRAVGIYESEKLNDFIQQYGLNIISENSTREEFNSNDKVYISINVNILRFFLYIIDNEVDSNEIDVDYLSCLGKSIITDIESGDDSILKEMLSIAMNQPYSIDDIGGFDVEL